MGDRIFLEQLSKHPELRKRMEKLLVIAEDLNEEIELADTAEERLIE